LLIAPTKQAQNLSTIDKHCDRIVNYQYYQAEQICRLALGGGESAVKQNWTAAPKISEALKWNNVLMLAHRCAYLLTLTV